MDFLKGIFCDNLDKNVEGELEWTLKRLGISDPDRSFDQIWPNLVAEFSIPDRYSIGKKLYAIAKMISRKETKIIYFFPIAEFFECNTKHMIKILQDISGKPEIIEFRFLKEDCSNKEERGELLDWNDHLLDQELKRDFENIRVELKKMRNLNSIKIDVFSFDLNQLKDLCGNLPLLTTLEVVINQDFSGQPGRFVDIASVVMAMSEKSNLTHIAHKLTDDIMEVTEPLGTFFPYLNQLEIDWGQPPLGVNYRYDGFYKFPELKQLTLTKLPCLVALSSFLNAYRELSDFTVDFKTSENLSMKPFQGLYRTLRKLVVGTIKPHVGKGSVWSLENFQSLTELEIGFAVIRDNVSDDVFVVPICSLFLAPNLEKVKLLGKLAVDAEHLQKMRLIEQGSAFFVITCPEDIVKKKQLCDSITEFYKENGVTPLSFSPTFTSPSTLPEHGGVEERTVISDATGEEQRRVCVVPLSILPAPKLSLKVISGRIFIADERMACKRKFNTDVQRLPRQSEERANEKMNRFLEQLRFNHDSSFKEVWKLLVNALKKSGPYSNEQKLYAVSKVILKIQTVKTLRFFPIAEFFEGNPKHMIQILKKISGKNEIAKFRFLKDDEEERLNQNWNGRLIYEDLKQIDLEKIHVELKKMSKLNTIKIDVYPISLNHLMDLCQNLKSLTTLEVFINYEIDLNKDRSKAIKQPMKHLKNFKYNVFVKENFHDLSSFEKVLDEFFMRSLYNAKVIGQPGRFVDITSVFEDIYENHHGQSRLTHIAHKLREDVTQPLGTIFGDVYQLQIEWCQEFGSDLNFDAFLDFPYISHLILTNVPERKCVRRFMNAYEQYLLEVTVKFGTIMKFSMKSFQYLNTTLRKLVVGVIKPLVGENSIWSLEDFEVLHELEIEFAVNWDVKGTLCVVPIYDLLSAPNLDKVKLFGDLAVDSEHLKRVHDGIISKTILKKVTKDFDLQIIMPGTENYVTTSKEEIECKKTLLKNIRKLFKKRSRL
ncbi:Hypothetical predicted protein [Cloeon dipterum]|uniref:Uncharacterized protein n=1 Tax=Cloeon dipterum TaxID=197152 RepID=A0A8S1E350_9INSE|nr:Hypothetical predicted protein [Cloeon dipterum]